MEELKKTGHGGARKGAGRRGHDYETVHVAFRLRVEDAELIRLTAQDLGTTQAEVIHELIEDYKRHCEE